MTNKFKGALGALGTGLVGLLAGCVSVGVQESNIPQFVEVDKGKPSVGVRFENTTVNYRAANGGFILGGSPSNQAIITGSLNDIIKEGVSVYVGSWADYNFGDGELHEIDYFAGVSFPLTEKLQATFEYAHWNYPSELLGSNENYDNVERVNLHRKGLVDLDLDTFVIFADKDIPETGYLVTGSVAKTVPLLEVGENSFSATLNTGSSFADGWYGLNGFTDVTPQASLNFHRGNIDASIFGGYQFVTPNVKDHPLIKNQVIYGGTVGFEY